MRSASAFSRRERRNSREAERIPNVRTVSLIRHARMGSRKKLLHVSFDPPAVGGITMRMEAGDMEFVENCSHIYPTLEQLCAGLWEAGRGLEVRPVVFYLEPAELEMRVRVEASGESTLELHWFPGRARIRSGSVVFAARSLTRELVFEFWRALRRLETSLSPEAFRRQWGGPFPTAEMHALNRLVEAWRGSV